MTGLTPAPSPDQSQAEGRGPSCSAVCMTLRSHWARTLTGGGEEEGGAKAEDKGGLTGRIS